MSWITSLFSWITGLFGGAPNQSAQVTQIQATAVKICSFLPTAESVLAVVNAAAPTSGVVTVSLIAHQICEIVTKQPPVPFSVAPVPLTLGSMDAAESPPVQTWQQGGVTIQGAFVR